MDRPPPLSPPRKGEGERSPSKVCSCLPAWLLSDGKIGDELPCLGLAEAMGFAPERRLVRPRPLFAALAPWGPPDPRDPALEPPYPAIAFASGRRTAPYLRALKRRSPGTFTIFLKDPRIGSRAADLLWVHEHDRLRGPNVLTTRTAPHTLSTENLAQARREPDPRLLALPTPRVALLVGGRSRHHPFGQADGDALLAAAEAVLAGGASLMATGSRRTPPALLVRLRDLARSNGRAFVWSGEGDNPYAAMLALADAILVTADSTNMVGEALAAGAPVHIVPLGGGHPRLDGFTSGLVADGAARIWAGRLEHWPTQPIDATPELAAEVGRRFALFRQRQAPQR